ncbi:MAG: hypothetical protein HRU09_00145 [Oligoflexales bacterium]|nr:hypothetical protein [Oligoflexales bacterium]
MELENGDRLKYLIVIAKTLGKDKPLEWATNTLKDFESNWAEQKYQWFYPA